RVRVRVVLLPILERDQPAVAFRKRRHALGERALVEQVANSLQLRGALPTRFLLGLHQFAKRFSQRRLAENVTAVGGLTAGEEENSGSRPELEYPLRVACERGR